jgi:RNA polymerase sigma-70 factor, ECF subfamily
MEQLAQRLAARTGRHLRAPELAAIDAQLAAAIAEAGTRWPELAALADPDALGDAFADAIAARVEGEDELGGAVGRLALPDLYLVVACLTGDRAGHAAVERLVREQCQRAIARLAGPISADDLAQELLVKLMVGGDGGPGKLGAFAGHGALHAWIRVAAVRTAISLGRKRHEVAIDDDALSAIADDGDDQSLAFMKSSYRAAFKLAFAAALARLPRRSRTLLRLQIIDQLTLEEVGAFYQVSRATAARWLAEARKELVSATHAELATTLGLAPDELAELTRLAASNLYSTLPRLLSAASSTGG